jgi:hypothetical protein
MNVLWGFGEGRTLLEYEPVGRPAGGSGRCTVSVSRAQVLVGQVMALGLP